MNSGSPRDLTRGRPGQLTRKSIVEAAARIPPEEFSLRALASDLGVSSQSLYHYFPSKESISAAIADEIAEAIPRIDRDLPWRAYLSGMINGYRAWLLENEYPITRASTQDGIAIFRIAGQRSENLLQRFEEFLSVLLRDGFKLDQAVEVWIAMQNFLRRSDLHRAAPEKMEAAWSEFATDCKLSEKGRFPILEKVSAADPPDLEALYARLIDVLIEGLSAVYGIE